MPGTFYPRCRAVLELIFDGFAEDSQDSEVFVVNVVPTECRITRNGYEQADSWSITFNALDLPIEPQLIRAGAAAIFLYQAQGAETRVVTRPKAVDKGGDRVADELRLESRPVIIDERPSVAGLFDEADLELSDDGKSVTIVGQDYTDYLLKEQWRPQENGKPRRIPSGKRLDLILQDVLNEVDEEGRLRLLLENIDAESLPTVGANETRGNKRGIPIKTETSYWQVLYGLAVRHGCLLFVRGLDVVLTRPANYADPFDPRVKRMAWGKNLSSLRLSRRFSKEVAPTIVIQSYDPKTKKHIEVDYPPGSFKKKKEPKASDIGKAKKVTIRQKARATRTSKKKTKTIRRNDEYQIIPALGITDPAVLREAAKLRYNDIARGERQMVVVTEDLKDLDGDDLLSLFAGDAVRVEFSEFNEEILQNDDVPAEKKIAYLIAKGFGHEISQVLVHHWDKLRFIDRPFRVGEVSYDYSTGDGIRVEMQLQDYIVVDGIRGAERPARRTTRDARLGPVGLSLARENAIRKQFGP